MTLPAHEQHTEDGTGNQRHDRPRRPAAASGFLDAVDEREDGHQGQPDTEQVQPSCVEVAVFRQQQGSGDQQEHHHRNGQQEDRAPPEPRQHEATDDRAEHDATHETARPHRDGRAPLLGVLEHVGDQGQGRGREGGSGDA
jgi:hypothetical protein